MRDYTNKNKAEGRGQKAEGRGQRAEGFDLFILFVTGGALPVGRF
jgi:hypothetical protein